jgi:hypothetical protein
VRELEHLLQPNVGEKHVVRSVDRNSVGHEECVRAPRIDQLSRVGIDFEDRWFRELFRGSWIESTARPMKHKDVAIGIEGDAGAFAELDGGRQLRPILGLFVRDRR